jgi:LuxR family transcriptional regulator, maltose regulon positive regulatory protein
VATVGLHELHQALTHAVAEGLGPDLAVLDSVAALHRRASQWYERNGEPSKAIRHALAGGDVERAAGLVELAIPAPRRSRQEATVRGWLEALPGDVVRVRPVLAVGLVGALMSGGEFEGVEDRLQDAEWWLEPTGGHEGTWAPPAGMVVVDQAEFARLPGVTEMYRAALALVRGDGPATIGHAQRAIDRAAESDHLTRAGASALMGLAFWGGGGPRGRAPGLLGLCRGAAADGAHR